MKKTGIITLLLFLLVASQTYSQDYYIPYNLKKAYLAETRDYSGAPGKNYFQNYSDYTIKASFEPKNGVLNGAGKINYHNNSRDTLYYMVIRLYHDIYKNGNLRDEEIPANYINEGVELKSIKIESAQYIGNDLVFLNRTGTNLIVSLPRYLYPGDSIEVEINWQTQLPPGHMHRFGNYGQSDWFVAYWYPQIAVYDDIDGWDEFNYTGLYEFYNDFNNYDVEIEVPSGNLVWATGQWLNPGEILTPKIYEKLIASGKSDKVISIVNPNDWLAQSVFRTKKKLSYRYSAQNICDFAFAVSDSYLWDATSVETDSVKHSRVSVNAVYPEENTAFERVAEIGANCIRHFSYYSVGVPYPFPGVTVFNGEGGMEFPMMVNEHSDDSREIMFITMHEIFHAYFPFATGNNERKYAWMDEGLTSYLPIETEKFLGGNYFQIPLVCRNYSDFAGSDLEVPLIHPTVLTRDMSYYQQAYYRSTIAFYMLEEYLGREEFRSFIRYFIELWKGKHPTGYDFLYALENFTDSDINWLIKPWFFEHGWADLAVDKAEIINNNLEIRIKNVGGLPVPVELSITLTNGEILKKSIAADCWKEGNVSLKVVIENVIDFKKIMLGSSEIPDKESQNNFFSKE